MYVTIKLDCEVSNQKEFCKHQGALLAAAKMSMDYNESRNFMIGVGPELYAEQWMLNYIQPSDGSLNDLILIYFVKILQATQNE